MSSCIKITKSDFHGRSAKSQKIKKASVRKLNPSECELCNMTMTPNILVNPTKNGSKERIQEF